MQLKKVMALCLCMTMAAGTLLTGCGEKNSADSSKGGEQVTISMMHHKIEAESGLKKLAEAYEKSHPNVKIEIEAIGGSADYNSVVKAKMASDPPTIWNYSSLGDLETVQSQVEDLSDQPWVKECNPSCLESAKGPDGKIYGMPMLIEGYGYLINRAIFEDAGVDVDSMWTFEGQKAGFDKLKSKIESGEMKAKYPQLTAVMELPAKEGWVLGDHMLQAILDKDFKSSREAYQAKTVPLSGADVYKKLVDFQASYTSNAKSLPNLNAIDYKASFDSGFLLEKVACVQQGSWTLPTIKEQDEKMLDKVDMIPYNLPDGSTDGKYVVFPGQFWIINKDVGEKKIAAAKDFLNWAYSSDEGKKVLVDECKFILPFGEAKADDNKVNQRLIDAYKNKKTIQGDLSLAGPSTWSKDVVGAAVQKYIAGAITWDQVIKEAKDKWAELRKK